MRLGSILLVSVLSLAPSLFAQEQTGTLEGRITDSSGAALANAAVTISGANLFGGARKITTSQSGEYRIIAIPVGAYEVTFELPGFATQINRDIRVQAATTFTLNAALNPSAVRETVTVTSASPMIDTASTDVNFSFSTELMDKVPNARDPWAIMNQAPGIVSDTINVGGSQTGNQPTFRGHGVDPTQNTYMLNGANVTDNTANGGSQFYFDVDSFSELQVQASSHGADVQTPGIVLNIVPKSGTNQLHGTASFFYSDTNTEWNNLDGYLRAHGVTNDNNLNRYFDGGIEAGGPLIKNRLWLWGAYRYQDVERFVTGTKNPDGSFPIDKTALWYPSAKLDWQITSKHHFNSYFNMAQKERFNRGLSALVPVESTWNQAGSPIARLFTFRDDWTVTQKLVLSFRVNIMDQGFSLSAQSGIDVPNTPTHFDLATGAYSVAPPYVSGTTKTLRSGAISGSYFANRFLGGSHELKFGFEVNDYHVAGNQGGSVATMVYPGDTQLQFFNGVPRQVILYASGAQSVSNPTHSGYIQDGWKMGRLRLDLGLRWDWQANSLDSVTAPKSRWFPAVAQTGTGNLITWNTLAPRLGVIFDVTGKAKTLLKTSYNRYYWQLWTGLGSQASTAGDRIYTYQWNDLNNDKQFQQGEQGSLLSVSDPSTNPVTIDKNLKPALTDEITAGFSQELMPNLVINASFIYRKDRHLNWKINPGISPSDYTAVTGTDPGPDGKLGTADDGGNLTFYSLDPSKTKLSPNFITNRPGFSQEYEGVEIQAVRRFTSRLQAVGSYTHGVQKENYGAGSFQNPQDIPFLDGTRIAGSRPNIVKIEGSYSLPHNLYLSGTYQYSSGLNFTRTVNALSALGRSLPQGNVAILSGPRNSQSYPGLNLLDMRLGYDLPLGEHRKASFSLDVFNLLNLNKVDSQQVISGATYGQVLDFIPPRVVRLGLKFFF
jgi:hypothetical protein